MWGEEHWPAKMFNVKCQNVSEKRAVAYTRNYLPTVGVTGFVRAAVDPSHQPILCLPNRFPFSGVGKMLAFALWRAWWWMKLQRSEACFGLISGKTSGVEEETTWDTERVKPRKRIKQPACHIKHDDWWLTEFLCLYVLACTLTHIYIVLIWAVKYPCQFKKRDPAVLKGL